MSFFKEALAIFKKTDLPFVKSYKESDKAYTFSFKKGKDITWRAGQHGLFTITHKKIKGATKPFTVSSSAKEEYVQITTEIGEQPSEFKQALLELTEGETIRMSGPVGAFYLKEDRPTLLIAGGIGVTPFRAMLKELENEQRNHPIHLLYIDSDKVFLYQDEFQTMASNQPFIVVSFLEARDDLYQKIDAFIQAYKNNGDYFVAGSKSMVGSMTNYLIKQEVSKKRIKKDSFYGY
ncbi:FAD-dependent oxidoreductase [Alkalihalobacillus pseudalcaliphilus]|uniref:FAD-dependent oxidoreductase n=1 Tax=Alkalihalobacillus pseudalcaliphilus TaxID=79884 RepID=UPI00064DBB20|nr:FAD-dependent oxidoreductase [Alkalihalobacillus pseudalcaliphilus]KMK75247.1 oxidoreductase [Alkalihalobacillus pseudalcaliphilus]